jgi:hypothetical protein
VCTAFLTGQTQQFNSIYSMLMPPQEKKKKEKKKKEEEGQ